MCLCLSASFHNYGYVLFLEQEILRFAQNDSACLPDWRGWLL